MSDQARSRVAVSDETRSGDALTEELPVDDGSSDDPLATDPFDDDLDAQLQDRAPWLPTKTTLLLGAAVLVVVGFLGGVVVQKDFGTASTGGGNGGTGFAANAGAGFARNNGGTAATAGTGGTGAGSGAITGTVKLVDGTTVYLTTADGETVTVKTSGTTTVRTEQAGALKDIPVGATVSVQGSTDADGTVNATQVTAQK